MTADLPVQNANASIRTSQRNPPALLYIDGRWRQSSSDKTADVVDPSSEEAVGIVAVATSRDVDDAVRAIHAGYAAWSGMSAFGRAEILENAARILKERSEAIAAALTREQGKPIAESRREILLGAQFVQYAAQEALRIAGRTLPSRDPISRRWFEYEPIGPVAAISPWNFPVILALRKVASALAAGCTVVLNPPNETPSCCAQMVAALADGGVPGNALALLFGPRAMISEHLITSPAIRAVTFTGSTAIGRNLASLAGANLKRTTMELGGHAPAIVHEDADLDRAVEEIVSLKFRNAGQFCIAPTRLLVSKGVFDDFLHRLVVRTEQIQVGPGMDPSSNMGPVASQRRFEACSRIVEDAKDYSAQLDTGGERLGNRGYFMAPTILSRVSSDALAMNEEPFGPIALVNPFEDDAEAMDEANRLPFGLGAYVFTSSLKKSAETARRLRCGMVSINGYGLGYPEVPFGGIMDSGHGHEGGPEAIHAFLVGKFVSETVGLLHG